MKKSLCFLIALLTAHSVFATDPKNYYNDPPGGHGMILFGQGDDFFISHLPMWMNPHDYQMIAKVKISQEIKNIIRKEQDNGTSLFSLAPSNSFVLPKLAGGDIPSFPAEIYKGHFERDGEEIGNSKVEFEQLILFKKLKRDEPSPPPGKQKYVLFGNADNQYLVHMAHGYPEIDEILKITPFKDPEVVNLITTNPSVNLVCKTKDTEKNMDGLDESVPQQCEVDQEISCEECQNNLDDITAASSVESKLPQLFNSIMIEKDIYTDTQDLGRGH